MSDSNARRWESSSQDKPLNREVLEIQDDAIPKVLQITSKRKKMAGTDSFKTFKVQPSSALLRAKNFLPHLASANAELENRLKTEQAEALDIENTEGYDGPVIEMNMALVERDTDTSESDSDLESDSDGDSSSNSDAQLTGEVTESNMRLPNAKSGQQKKPVIEVLQDNQKGEKGSLTSFSESKGLGTPGVESNGHHTPGADKEPKVQKCYIPQSRSDSRNVQY